MSDPNRTLRVFAAGSLRNVLAKLVDASGIDTNLATVFGPAGLLRERIEGGDVPDLFLSANMDHPAALARDRVGLCVRPFARNALVAIARPSLHLTTGTVLDGLLANGVRIGTSTPGADPSGDYAQALFDRADAARPGSGAALRARATALVGGRDNPPVRPGDNPARVFLAAGHVDVFLSYATNARPLADAFDVVPPPDQLAVIATYGLVALSPRGGALATAIADAPACRAALDAVGFLRVRGGCGPSTASLKPRYV